MWRRSRGDFLRIDVSHGLMWRRRRGDFLRIDVSHGLMRRRRRGGLSKNRCVSWSHVEKEEGRTF